MGCVADRLGFGGPFQSDSKHGFKAPQGIKPQDAALDRIIYPMLHQDLPNPMRCRSSAIHSIIGSSVQCSSPSQVGFRAVLVETYLTLRCLLCGTDAAKVTIKMPSKCFTLFGCVSQKGRFQGTLRLSLLAMVDVNVSKVNVGGSQILRHPRTTQISKSHMAKRDDGSERQFEMTSSNQRHGCFSVGIFRALLEGDTQNKGHEMDRLHFLKTVFLAQFWRVTSVSARWGVREG